MSPQKTKQHAVATDPSSSLPLKPTGRIMLASPYQQERKAEHPISVVDLEGDYHEFSSVSTQSTPYSQSYYDKRDRILLAQQQQQLLQQQAAAQQQQQQQQQRPRDSVKHKDKIADRLVASRRRIQGSTNLRRRPSPERRINFLQQTAKPSNTSATVERSIPPATLQVLSEEGDEEEEVSKASKCASKEDPSLRQEDEVETRSLGSREEEIKSAAHSRRSTKEDARERIQQQHGPTNEPLTTRTTTSKIYNNNTNAILYEASRDKHEEERPRSYSSRGGVSSTNASNNRVEQRSRSYSSSGGSSNSKNALNISTLGGGHSQKMNRSVVEPPTTTAMASKFQQMEPGRGNGVVAASSWIKDEKLDEGREVCYLENSAIFKSSHSRGLLNEERLATRTKESKNQRSTKMDELRRQQHCQDEPLTTRTTTSQLYKNKKNNDLYEDSKDEHDEQRLRSYSSSGGGSKKNSPNMSATGGGHLQKMIRSVVVPPTTTAVASKCQKMESLSNGVVTANSWRRDELEEGREICYEQDAAVFESTHSHVLMNEERSAFRPKEIKRIICVYSDDDDDESVWGPRLTPLKTETKVKEAASLSSHRDEFLSISNSQRANETRDAIRSIISLEKNDEEVASLCSRENEIFCAASKKSVKSKFHTKDEEASKVERSFSWRDEHIQSPISGVLSDARTNEALIVAAGTSFDSQPTNDVSFDDFLTTTSSCSSLSASLDPSGYIVTSPTASHYNARTDSIRYDKVKSVLAHMRKPLVRGTAISGSLSLRRGILTVPASSVKSALGDVAKELNENCNPVRGTAVSGSLSRHRDIPTVPASSVNSELGDDSADDLNENCNPVLGTAISGSLSRRRGIPTVPASSVTSALGDDSMGDLNENCNLDRGTAISGSLSKSRDIPTVPTSSVKSALGDDSTDDFSENCNPVESATCVPVVRAADLKSEKGVPVVAATSFNEASGGGSDGNEVENGQPDTSKASTKCADADWVQSSSSVAVVDSATLNETNKRHVGEVIIKEEPLDREKTLHQSADAEIVLLSNASQVNQDRSRCRDPPAKTTFVEEDTSLERKEKQARDPDETYAISSACSFANSESTENIVFRSHYTPFARMLCAPSSKAKPKPKARPPNDK